MISWFKERDDLSLDDASSSILDRKKEIYEELYDGGAGNDRYVLALDMTPGAINSIVTSDPLGNDSYDLVLSLNSALPEQPEGSVGNRKTSGQPIQINDRGDGADRMMVSGLEEYEFVRLAGQEGQPDALLLTSSSATVLIHDYFGQGEIEEIEIHALGGWRKLLNNLPWIEMAPETSIYYRSDIDRVLKERSTGCSILPGTR